jgi:hypothetical protein
MDNDFKQLKEYVEKRLADVQSSMDAMYVEAICIFYCVEKKEHTPIS